MKKGQTALTLIEWGIKGNQNLNISLENMLLILCTISIVLYHLSLKYKRKGKWILESRLSVPEVEVPRIACAQMSLMWLNYNRSHEHYLTKNMYTVHINKLHWAWVQHIKCSPAVETDLLQGLRLITTSWEATRCYLPNQGPCLFPCVYSV